MPIPMEASTRRVSDLLTPTRRFEVPRFQRPFAWSSEEAGALFGDIDTARLRLGAKSDGCGWFIGDVVLARPDPNSADLIVDGHQRLTTITILLSLLRDLDQQSAARFGPHVCRDEKDGTCSPILTLRGLDATFFFEAIQKPGATLGLNDVGPGENDSQANIVGVAMALRERLAEMSPEDRFELGVFALDRCCLIEVVSTDVEEACRLFGVLNTRGKDLRPGDVLKSELLNAIDADARGRVADAWEETEAALGEQRFGALFSHIRTISTLRRRERSVFAELRDALDPLSDPDMFVHDIVARYGRLYHDVCRARLPIGPGSDDAERLLRGLKRVRNRDWEAPALAYLASRPSYPDLDAVETAALLRFLTALDRRAFVMLLQSGDEHMRAARYRPALGLIRDGAPLDQILGSLALNHSEIRIAREVLNGAIGSKDRVRLPVLTRIDERLGGGGGDYDRTDLTVEHVLPRNPAAGEDAASIIAHDAWSDAWPNRGERKRWLHRLGNLTLLSRRRNNAAANFDFERKKRVYQDYGEGAQFALTAQVVAEAAWTPDVVKRRHRLLFDTACAIWDL